MFGVAIVDDMQERFVVVPSAYVLLRRDDNVLLQLRQNTGYMDGHWASGAAGHVEVGESVLEAAQRETQEELGVHVNIADLSPICTMHRAGRPGDPTSERVDFFFTVTEWRGEPRIAEPAKAADLRWFALESLPPSVVPHEHFVLEGLNLANLPTVATFGFGDQDDGLRA